MKVGNPPPLVLTMVIFALVLRAFYITFVSDPWQAKPPRFIGYDPSLLPSVVIFRRSHKTGSSSMLSGLLPILKKFGYIPVMRQSDEVEPLVRAEQLRASPRGLFIFTHNHFTRAIHPQRNAIIIDTIRDGFAQITSFCRQKRHVETCDDEMIDCMGRKGTRNRITYRYAGRLEEDADTYIDLPLSSAHPALSTTVLRTVFPGVTLNMDNYRVRDSACPEYPELRKVYDELYTSYEDQVDKLRRRLLLIAGYPTYSANDVHGNVTMVDKMDAAELLERRKYEFRRSESTYGGQREVTKRKVTWLWKLRFGVLRPKLGSDHFQERPVLKSIIWEVFNKWTTWDS